jgi:uncharacterized Zn finger protein
MAGEDPLEPDQKAQFGRRVRRSQGSNAKGELDHSVEGGAFLDPAPASPAPKKPKVRIGPKSRRSEAAEAQEGAPPPGIARPSGEGNRSAAPKSGPRPHRNPSKQERPVSPKPVQAGANIPNGSGAESTGGVRRKRRRRKGRRTDDGPSESPVVVAPTVPPPEKQLSFFGAQVLPPVEEDLEEVPSGIFATSDLIDSDNDGDSDSDDASGFDGEAESDMSFLEVVGNASSQPDAPSSNPGSPKHAESRSSRERKRRKKRRERQELPPVDRSTGYWWAEQWVRSFEMLFPSNASRSRLAKGRTYARRGQVLELEVGPNGVLARVQGSRPRPYQVRLELNRLRRETWGRILHQLVGKATFLAQLLEGHLPPEIEEVFFSAGARLFPHGDVDIRVRCNCPDPVVPCKHVAALNYALADALQRDPFLLFAMRGKGRDQFLQDLREMRGRDQRVNVPAPAEEDDLSEFWRMGRLAEAVLRPTGWSMGNDPARLLQSLGEPQLDGIREGLFLPMLEATYRQVAESMRRLPKDA